MNDAKGNKVAYRVETTQLALRCWSPRDATDLREALAESDAHLRPWIPFMKEEPRTFAQTCQWLREARASFDQDQAYHYAVFDRHDGTLLGGNMLNARVGSGGLELGYWTRLAAIGRGLATEATGALIRSAFEIHGAQRVEIHCAPQNRPSAAIPARLGFCHEATLKSRAVNTEGVVTDLMIWTLFGEDYSNSPASQVPMTAYDCAGHEINLAGWPKQEPGT
jgi:RimJ/RimL family protein N-acetyltransferase